MTRCIRLLCCQKAGLERGLLCIMWWSCLADCENVRLQDEEISISLVTPHTSHTHVTYYSIIRYVMIRGMQCWSVLDAWVWGEKPLNQIFIIKGLDAAMQGNCGEPRLLLLLIVWPTEWLNTMATLSLPALVHSPDKSCKRTFANFEVSQSWRRHLLGSYPGWKCLTILFRQLLIG